MPLTIKLSLLFPEKIPLKLPCMFPYTVQIKQEYDLSIIYNIREVPDKISGRGDIYKNVKFKSSIKNAVFLIECRHCGIKKII